MVINMNQKNDVPIIRYMYRDMVNKYGKLILFHNVFIYINSNKMYYRLYTGARERKFLTNWGLLLQAQIISSP